MSSESKMSEESHAIVPASTTTTERATEITTTMSNQYGLTTQQMNFLTDPSFIDGLNPSSPDFVTRVAETVTQRILESRNLSSTSLIEDQAESQLITSQLQSVQMVTGRRIPQRISEVIQNQELIAHQMENFQARKIAFQRQFYEEVFRLQNTFMNMIGSLGQIHHVKDAMQQLTREMENTHRRRIHIEGREMFKAHVRIYNFMELSFLNSTKASSETNSVEKTALQRKSQQYRYKAVKWRKIYSEYNSRGIRMIPDIPNMSDAELHEEKRKYSANLLRSRALGENTEFQETRTENHINSNKTWQNFNKIAVDLIDRELQKRMQASISRFIEQLDSTDEPSQDADAPADEDIDGVNMIEIDDDEDDYDNVIPTASAAIATPMTTPPPRVTITLPPPVGSKRDRPDSGFDSRQTPPPQPSPPSTSSVSERILAAAPAPAVAPVAPASLPVSAATPPVTTNQSRPSGGLPLPPVMTNQSRPSGGLLLPPLTVIPGPRPPLVPLRPIIASPTANSAGVAGSSVPIKSENSSRQ